jgi:hypothetical protein
MWDIQAARRLLPAGVGLCTSPAPACFRRNQKETAVHRWKRGAAVSPL